MNSLAGHLVHQSPQHLCDSPGRQQGVLLQELGDPGNRLGVTGLAPEKDGKSIDAACFTRRSIASTCDGLHGCGQRQATSSLRSDDANNQDSSDRPPAATQAIPPDVHVPEYTGNYLEK